MASPAEFAPAIVEGLARVVADPNQLANHSAMSNPNPAIAPTINQIRSHFPALGRGTVFLDNAGGSQLPGDVIAAARQYMIENYVQTGADYAASQRATENVRAAHELVKHFVNGGGPEGARVGQGTGEVIFGASSTDLCHRLANAYAEARAAGALGSRNEIIVGTYGHEANIGCWMKLAQRGFTVREWTCEVDADGTPRPRIDTLKKLLNSNTLLVAFAQVSNILGEAYDVGAITKMCHAAGAKVMVDGVAYAPHHAPDVAAWGCDWYVYSAYKVFGPHMGAMFGRHDAFAPLTGPNHSFIARDYMPGKWEPGGSNHESCAMINALWPYVAFMAGAEEKGTMSHAAFKQAFARMAKLEDGLMRKVMGFLSERKDVRVLGPRAVDEKRVCIASFVKEGASSAGIAKALNARGFGVRYGNFYSRRLCEQLGIDAADGVVRISMAHYNSEEEVDGVLSAFGEVM